MKASKGSLLALALLATGLVPASSAQACSWPIKFEADTTNVAFPDDNANYWIARFAVSEETSLRITGIFPKARYFSFHVYDPSQAPIDGIADLEIDPDQPGTNRFRGGDEGGTYSVRVVAGDRPEAPAPNTIYAGERNRTETLIYRVYVSDDQDSIQGDVPLPDLHIETPAGDASLPACEPLPPSTGGTVTEAVADSSMPGFVPRGLPYPAGQNPPRFVKFWGTAHEFARRFGNAADYTPKNGGFLSNRHIAYLYALFSRQEGDLVVVRGKAPTAPDTRGGVPVTAERDVRYFSICMNELATQRYVACLRDDEISVDEDGYFTIVVSDPEARPSNAQNWIPWGGIYYDGNIIYRHMLPSGDFAGAIQNVPYGVPEASTMGDYYPSIAYCTKARFEASDC